MHESNSFGNAKFLDDLMSSTGPTSQAPLDDASCAWRDAWEVAHHDQAHTHTVGLHGADWPDHPYCCDFIWVSTDIAPRVRDLRVNQATDASDHQPVLLQLDD